MLLAKLAAKAAMSRSGVAAGVRAAGQVGTAAAELMRSRRDPAVIARRRYRSARQRLWWWLVIAVAGAGATAGFVLSMVHTGVGAMPVVKCAVAALAAAWGGAGAYRAFTDVRRYGRQILALPPPQPARRPVTQAVKAELEQLDNYSDSLRTLVGMIGVTGTSDDRQILRTRREVLDAADEVETQIRAQADELTDLQQAWRGAPAAAREELTTAAAASTARIRTGVAEYGRLVTATSEVVSASGNLRSAAGGDRAHLSETTDRLRALAAGMRELSAR